MAFPRLYAAVAVVLLIGSLSIVGVLAITGPDRDFTFKTATGKLLQFQCRNQCRASAGHLQRHINEKANTDVYYLQGPGNTLLVIDVD